ncbi:hypothetical protein ABRP69_11650, partial [Corynebacterium sp. KPL3806]|uniref:hypothetical protein n=1 Tax=Corynebacterium sp. KPL3806 TaxID=3158323 RepID=UPI0032EDC84A
AWWKGTSLPQRDAGFKVSTIWGSGPRENDPMAYWVRANCAVQPILTNPNMAMVAHVVKPGPAKKAGRSAK